MKNLCKVKIHFRNVLYYVAIFCLSTFTFCSAETSGDAKRKVDGINATSIQYVLEHPDEFTTQEVTIMGKVISSTKIPYVKSSYTLEDESGASITVHRPNDQSVPTEGAEIVAKGIVNQKFVIGGMNYTILEEKSIVQKN